MKRAAFAVSRRYNFRRHKGPVEGCCGWKVPMAYYKVRIEVWCDWNPAESDLADIAQAMGIGEAICTMREIIAVADRPQDIEDEEAMSFFGDQRAMRMRWLPRLRTESPFLIRNGGFDSVPSVCSSFAFRLELWPAFVRS
jgi:hypothetical protein